jgi:hypothetical protein
LYSILVSHSCIPFLYPILVSHSCISFLFSDFSFFRFLVLPVSRHLIFAWSHCLLLSVSLSLFPFSLTPSNLLLPSFTSPAPCCPRLVGVQSHTASSSCAQSHAHSRSRSQIFPLCAFRGFSCVCVCWLARAANQSAIQAYHSTCACRWPL